MKDGPLYLCLIEKEKRGRIKIGFEGSFAKAILATCHTPKTAGMSFTWEIKVINWNLEIEQERKDFEQLIATCQKEERRYFKIAVEEAISYSKRLTRQKKHKTKNSRSRKYGSPGATPRFVDHTQLVSEEEIIAKILKLRAGHS